MGGGGIGILDLDQHFFEGTFADNSPSAGYVAWSGIKIRFRGTTYAVADGNTNEMYIWWELSAPTVFSSSDDYPTALTPDDAVVALNESGAYRLVMIRGGVVNENMIGEEGRGWYVAMTTLAAERSGGGGAAAAAMGLSGYGGLMVRTLGGVDGLLHITDMSWGRVTHPSELVAIGDVIKVKILNYEEDRQRISLGFKQLQPYPWENIEEKYPEASLVKGKVVSITDYGAFVELEEGVEGLVHISEMSWTQHIRHPSKILQIGDIITFRLSSY